MDITEKEGTEGPLPNLKGGHSVRADFKQTDVVVKPLVRDRDGLIREDLLRLKGMSDYTIRFLDIQGLLTLKALFVWGALGESLA